MMVDILCLNFAIALRSYQPLIRVIQLAGQAANCTSASLGNVPWRL